MVYITASYIFRDKKMDEIEEERELRRKYKAQTGKRFRRKTGNALKELRTYRWPAPLKLVVRVETDDEWSDYDSEDDYSGYRSEEY